MRLSPPDCELLEGRACVRVTAESPGKAQHLNFLNNECECQVLWRFRESSGEQDGAALMGLHPVRKTKEKIIQVII